MPQSDINEVLKSHASELMAIEGVTAIAIGELEDKTPCIKIYIVEDSEQIRNLIPANLEGHPIVVSVSGEIKPMDDDS